jgi:hypothetical protein
MAATVTEGGAAPVLAEDTISRVPYTLDLPQLEAALEALRKASETFRLTPVESRLYLWLGRCAKLEVFGFIATAAAFVAGKRFPGTYGVMVVSALIFVSANAAATILLLVNFTLVIDAFRQRRLLKQLGLHTVSRSAWRAERRRHLGGWIGGAAFTTVGVVLVVLAGLMLVVLASVKVDHGRYIVAIVGLLLLPGGTVLVWRMVQRSRERLAIVGDADRLRAMLTSIQARVGADQRVVVPAALLEKVAGIENAQIARERAHAVVTGVRSVDRGFGLLVAHDVTAQKAALVPSQRLAVEELIDRVLAETQSPRDGGSESNGLRRASTLDGISEIDFHVDTSARRIHIVALRVRGTVGADH